MPNILYLTHNYEACRCLIKRGETLGGGLVVKEGDIDADGSKE